MTKSYPSTKLGNEGQKRREIIAIIGIAHDDELASRRSDSAHERAAIAPSLYFHQPHAFPYSNLLRSIRAAVVSDDDLSFDLKIV